MKEKKILTNEDVIKNVADSTGYSRTAVDEIIEATLKDIMFNMSKGRQVRFLKFGVFLPKHMAQRVARNPKTNEQIVIPARVVPAFRAGSDLKSAVVREVK